MWQFYNVVLTVITWHSVDNVFCPFSFQVFELFSSYTDNLAPLGTTKSNESFNNSVCVHAPKRLHFSGYASLEGRVAFAVATKNSEKSVVYTAHYFPADIMSCKKPGFSTCRTDLPSFSCALWCHWKKNYCSHSRVEPLTLPFSLQKEGKRLSSYLLWRIKHEGKLETKLETEILKGETNQQFKFSHKGI